MPLHHSSKRTTDRVSRSSASRQAHVVVITHTPNLLRCTLLGVACQTHRPDSITLSCDSDDTAIEQVAREACDEFGIGLTLILRPPTGTIRMSQTRNNAVRELLRANPVDDAWLLFLDGDCVPEPSLIEKHLARARNRRLVIGWRFDLTESQTDAFDEQAMRDGRRPVEPSDEQWRSVRKRHMRYLYNAFLKRFGLTKQHKPKMIGAHMSVSLRDFRAINGFDESFEGWAQEDDNLNRRLYLSGCRPIIAVRDIHCFHQYHLTRAPGDWNDSSNAHRLDEPCQIRAEFGLDNPMDQAPIRVLTIKPGHTLSQTDAGPRRDSSPHQMPKTSRAHAL